MPSPSPLIPVANAPTLRRQVRRKPRSPINIRLPVHRAVSDDPERTENRAEARSQVETDTSEVTNAFTVVTTLCLTLSQYETATERSPSPYAPTNTTSQSFNARPDDMLVTRTGAAMPGGVSYPTLEVDHGIPSRPQVSQTAAVKALSCLLTSFYFFASSLILFVSSLISFASSLLFSVVAIANAITMGVLLAKSLLVDGLLATLM
ncbi:hypothetical protein OF83DRAFT_1084763 [Amylostereum chailletii]|nr:hypothetical protein OF83DRAFT_1084763 [Amylostereum chailletii]